MGASWYVRAGLCLILATIAISGAAAAAPNTGIDLYLPLVSRIEGSVGTIVFQDGISHATYLVSTAGEPEPQQVLPPWEAVLEYDQIHCPSWSADAQSVRYRRGDGSYVAVDREGGNPRTLMAEPDGAGTSYTLGDPSPDFTKLAFTGTEYPYQLYVMEGDSGKLDRLTDRTRSTSAFEWSPNSALIAAIRLELKVLDKPGEIVIFDVRSGGKAPVSDDLYGMNNVAWSPDSSEFAFESYEELNDPNSEPIIFVAGANGLGLRSLGRGSRPMWWPDGSKIIFSSGDDHYVMNKDGSDRHLFSAGTGSNQLRWTANGRKLVFRAWPPPPYDDYPTADLYVMDANGQNLKKITTGFDVACFNSTP